MKKAKKTTVGRSNVGGRRGQPAATGAEIRDFPLAIAFQGGVHAYMCSHFNPPTVDNPHTGELAKAWDAGVAAAKEFLDPPVVPAIVSKVGVESYNAWQMGGSSAAFNWYHGKHSSNPFSDGDTGHDAWEAGRKAALEFINPIPPEPCQHPDHLVECFNSILWCRVCGSIRHDVVGKPGPWTQPTGVTK